MAAIGQELETSEIPYRYSSWTRTELTTLRRTPLDVETGRTSMLPYR
jgi:hypothetical protein